MAYGEVAHLSIGWGRLFFLYGPGEKRGRLVSDAICKLLSRQELAASHGLQRRDFMHVSDAAEAFAALVDSDVQGPVNIGSGQAVSIRSILELIVQETGAGDLVRYAERHVPANDPPVIEAAVERLSDEVGFRPHYDLAGGLAETISWWRQRLHSQ
jgi:nucleoside-diphosphate-sugar epimerase